MLQLIILSVAFKGNARVRIRVRKDSVPLSLYPVNDQTLNHQHLTVIE